jgi:hypothetical protein
MPPTVSATLADARLAMNLRPRQTHHQDHDNHANAGCRGSLSPQKHHRRRQGSEGRQGIGGQQADQFGHAAAASLQADLHGAGVVFPKPLQGTGQETLQRQSEQIRVQLRAGPLDQKPLAEAENGATQRGQHKPAGG